MSLTQKLPLDFDTYFEAEHKYKIPFRKKEIEYCSSLEKFYEDVIKQNIKELYEKNRDNLLSWCKFIDEISNPECEEIPFYWIRKYESSTPYGRIIDEDGEKYSKTEKRGKEYIKRWNTRRGALTVVTDRNNKPQYAYMFVSNFDAQEIYNMVFNIPNPNKNQFLANLKKGKYHLHFDSGGSCIESDIAYCVPTGTTRGGVMTEAKWYLAHIEDVNGDYYDDNGTPVLNQARKNEIQKLFPSGDSLPFIREEDVKATKWGVIKEWEKASNLKGKNEAVLKLLGLTGDEEKRIRVISKEDWEIEKDKRVLKAHFLRFIHPFNYFLVPSQAYVFNSAKNQIGEYYPLISLVRNKIIEQIANDDELRKYYCKFYREIMTQKSSKIDPNWTSQEFSENLIKKENEKDVHILYGLDLEIRKKVELLEESGFLVNDMEIVNAMENIDKDKQDLLFEYDDGTNDAMKEIAKVKSKTEVDVNYIVDKIKAKFKDACKKKGLDYKDHDEIVVRIGFVQKQKKGA